MASGETRSTGHMCQDLEDIAGWIEAVRGVMSHLDQGITVSDVSWTPPGGINPPIAVPKCFWPQAGAKPPASIADLVQTLASLRDWTAALAETLACLPPGTPIPRLPEQP